MSKVIMEYPDLCEPCGKPMPPWDSRYDDPAPLVWWQMPTDDPDVTRMVYYHYACGDALRHERGWEVCWAGCQRVIYPDQEKVWTDPDGDGHFMWMHSKCAGVRAVILFDIADAVHDMKKDD